MPIEERRSGLTVPKKDGLTVPDRKSWVVLNEKHGIKLVHDETEKQYMIIGGSRVYKYRSSTWAEKKHERLTNVYEKLKCQ